MPRALPLTQTALLLGPSVATAAALDALQLPHGGAALRDVATFDFGWRWRLGLHAVPPPGAPPDEFSPFLFFRFFSVLFVEVRIAMQAGTARTHKPTF